MKDHEQGEVLSRWAEISSKAAQLALAGRRAGARRRGSLNISLATIAALSAIVLAFFILQRPGGGSSDVVGGVGNLAPSGIEPAPEPSTETARTSAPIGSSEVAGTGPSHERRKLGNPSTTASSGEGSKKRDRGAVLGWPSPTDVRPGPSRDGRAREILGWMNGPRSHGVPT